MDEPLLLQDLPQVRVISITKPIHPELEHLTAEELIVYIARVSNPSNQLNTATAPKLLKYCITHGHWSIFEQVSMTVEIKVARAIAAQILRHRSFVFQEYSQRFAPVQAFQVVQARLSHTKNRQSSIECEDESLKSWFEDAQREVIKFAHQKYQAALNKGIAKEQARFLLPLSAVSTLYMTGSIRSWIHYLQVRCQPDTQKEHREVALKIKQEFTKLFPVISSFVFSAQN